MLRRSSGLHTPEHEERPAIELEQETELSDTASDAPTVVIDWTDQDFDQPDAEIPTVSELQASEIERPRAPTPDSESQAMLSDNEDDLEDEVVHSSIPVMDSTAPEEYASDQQIFAALDSSSDDEDEVTELADELEAERDRNAQATAKIDQLEVSLRDWQFRFELMQQQLALTAKHADCLKQLAAEQKACITSQESALDRIELAVDAFEEELNDMEFANGALINANRALAALSAKKTDEISELKAENSRLHKTIERQQSELVGLDHKLHHAVTTTPRFAKLPVAMFNRSTSMSSSDDDLPELEVVGRSLSRNGR